MEKDVFKRVHSSVDRRCLTFLNCRDSICLNTDLGQHATALFITTIATYNRIAELDKRRLESVPIDY